MGFVNELPSTKNLVKKWSECSAGLTERVSTSTAVHRSRDTSAEGDAWKKIPGQSKGDVNSRVPLSTDQVGKLQTAEGRSKLLCQMVQYIFKLSLSLGRAPEAWKTSFNAKAHAPKEAQPLWTRSPNFSPDEDQGETKAPSSPGELQTGLAAVFLPVWLLAALCTGHQYDFNLLTCILSAKDACGSICSYLSLKCI